MGTLLHCSVTGVELDQDYGEAEQKRMGVVDEVNGGQR